MLHTITIKFKVRPDLHGESTGMGHLLRDSLGIDNLLKHVNHVVVLAMDVANDDDWLLDSQQVRLVLYRRTNSIR